MRTRDQIALNLKSAREKHKLTRGMLAEMIGSTEFYVYRWERGMRPIPDQYVLPLADILEISPRLLLPDPRDK